MSMYKLDERIAQHLVSGGPIQVGTRDSTNRTSYTRSWGCKINDDRQSMILFLYRSYCPQALQNIRDNGNYAAAFINVFSYETYQIKGSRARILGDLAPYTNILEAYYRSQCEMVTSMGLPQLAADSMAGKSREDYIPVYCPIDECFCQTPGPGAGDRV